jgi:hypothetical protein
MKSLALALSVALISLSTVAFAQADGQKSFDKLKTLAGSWEGTITTFPPAPDVEGKHVQVTLRVTSMGNVLMHEMRVAGRPDDPITMLYMDSGRLLLTHYCDAGNRPLMVATASPDGNTVEFAFVDVAGSTQHGHMHHVMFSVIDPNHHIEEWTFMLPGGKSVRAHFDLHRVQ